MVSESRTTNGSCSSKLWEDVEVVSSLIPFLFQGSVFNLTIQIFNSDHKKVKQHVNVLSYFFSDIWYWVLQDIRLEVLGWGHRIAPHSNDLYI